MVPEFGGTVRLQGFGIGDFDEGLANEGGIERYQAPWTSSLEVELVGQDKQDVDVDIPFVATLESLALHDVYDAQRRKRERKIDGRGVMTSCS